MRHGFSKVLHWLLIALIIIPFIFPEKAFAWSGAKDWLGNYPTHQEILKAAYKILQSRDGPVLENSRFPSIDDVLKYEGMGWTTNITFDIIGHNQYNVLGPGPDDETRTAESDHYYNPQISKGGGPDATKTYFSEMCDGMYTSNASPEASLARGAAWSSHFISDMCVPYHVIGMPGADAKSMDAAGNYLIDDENKTGPGFLSSSPTSRKEPPPAFGRDGNFSQNIRRYVIWSGEAGPKAKRDWFDPWYLNGGIYIFGWGWGDFQFLRSSHVEYEKYGHTQYMKNPYAGQDTNVPAWTNALPAWDNPYGGQENMAQDYARKAAKITRDNLEKYWKDPASAIYNAVELSYTLWRSSISALKLKYEVTPTGAPGSGTYRVKGTISNAAEAKASQVQARISINGASIKNASLQPARPVDLDGGGSTTVTWDVTTNNIDKCKIKLEVIGQYQGTPDLGYAKVESSNASIDVSVSPGIVDAGKPVTITVRIQPETDIPPTIKDWGPLQQSGSFSKQTDGSFTGDFTVKSDTKDKTYTITVESGQPRQTGSANITVGKAFNSCTIDFQIGVTMGGDGNPVFTHDTRFSVEATGSFTGQKFEGTITKTVADNVLVEQGSSNSISVTVAPTSDPKVWQVTDYQLSTSYSCLSCYVPVKQGTIQVSGKKALQAQRPASGNVVTAKVSGESARSCIDSFNWTIQYQSFSKPDNKTVYNTGKLVGTPVSYFQITLQNK